MKGKLGEQTAKGNELTARSRVSAAQAQVNDALKSLGLADPTSALGRYEERIRREEATAAGSRTSLPHPWTPSSRPWKISASRLRWRPGSLR